MQGYQESSKTKAQIQSEIKENPGDAGRILLSYCRDEGTQAIALQIFQTLTIAEMTIAMAIGHAYAQDKEQGRFLRSFKRLRQDAIDADKSAKEDEQRKSQFALRKPRKDKDDEEDKEKTYGAKIQKLAELVTIIGGSVATLVTEVSGLRKEQQNAKILLVAIKNETSVIMGAMQKNPKELNQCIKDNDGNIKHEFKQDGKKIDQYFTQIKKSAEQIKKAQVKSLKFLWFQKTALYFLILITTLIFILSRIGCLDGCCFGRCSSGTNNLSTQNTTTNTNS